MDSDVDVSRWVLELLLRDRDKASIAKRVLAVAPLSDHDWRLKKTLLLRTIESQILDDAAVTETVLESLESIEVLDRRQGIPATDAIRAAYCAVATELTVKFLVCFDGKPGGKYMEAVDRIWRGRVRVLEEAEGCAMVSAELRERRDEVEAGIWDMKVSKKLGRLDSRNDALRSVAAYVKEAFAMLGPPFVAWAVEFGMEKGSLSSEGEPVAVESDGNVGGGSEGRVASGVEMEVEMENGVELGYDSMSEVNGDNVGDQSDIEAQRGANVNSGSEREEQREIGANDGNDKEVQRANGDRVSNATEEEVRDNDVGEESESQVVTAAYLNSKSEMDHHTRNGVQVQVVGAGRSPPTRNRGHSFERETPRARALRGRHGPAKIRDEEDVATEASAGIYNSVSSSEVKRLHEELKSSVFALQDVVTDPLPWALHVSEIVRSELGRKPVDHVGGDNGGAANPSVEKNTACDQSTNDNHAKQTISQNDVPQPVGKENDTPYLSVDNGKDTENAGTKDVNPGNPSCSYHNNVSRASLMERNSTARTYEWDDSLGMSPEQKNSRERLHLRSPKRIAVSPLKKYEDKRLIKRRKPKRWSLQEEETLRTGVQKYGRGNWKIILDAYRDVFEERTEVDLKDKWRNLTK